MSDWWRGAAIYQIYPRSFQDSNGDGTGDLAGITSRLDHVASLGVDAIWLSPVFTSPMADMGYDVSDYTDIDPIFGTLEDFDALVARAHELGLKVIIDQVLSHSSDEHPFFEQSRQDKTNDKADWYVWADPCADGTPPNNWLSIFGGSAWEWEPRRRQYYLHNFLIEQPDFNLHHPEVQDWLLGTMQFWLDRGVDGFRLDTVNFYMHDQSLRDNPVRERAEMRPEANPYDMQNHIFSKTQPENIAFLKRIRALTDRYSDRTVVGEVGDHADRAIEIMAEYTSGNDRLHMAYSFDMLGPNFSAKHFRSRIENFFASAADGWPSWSFSNHDVHRHLSRWAGHAHSSDELAKQAIALLAGFEGTIGIYQGEELGQTETDLEYHELTDPAGLRFWPEVKGRDGCRTPMVWEKDAPHAGFSAGTPWLPVKAPQAARAVDTQESRKDSVLNAYRETIAFRKSRPELVHGNTEFIDLPEPVLAFRRTLEGRTITCVYNLSPNPVSLSITGETATTGPEARLALGAGQLSLGPNGFAFLESEAASAPVLEPGGKDNKLAVA
ncbi:alpha-glucosidase family protein [Cucumibacter marinus]|uniref:alpha-glucosidase family protein n=1 Tax=Cucumibacter marinus TaxID=1121252 RepID=UPI00040E2E8E|nr:alpha-glucosidase family protein [Cucumibacter marinus]